MELWIRSQSKETLMKVTKVHICDGVIFANGYTEFDERIGEYATRERALEVLDEIEERIMLINTINLAKYRDSLIAYKNALTEEKIKGLGYPYQMPEN